MPGARPRALTTMMSVSLTCLGLAACSTPSSGAGPAGVAQVPASSSSGVGAPTYPRQVTDALGKVHTISTAPKIGCDWAGCLEIMADLGLVAQATGFSADDLKSTMWAPDGPPAHLVKDSESAEEWGASGADIYVTRVPESPENTAIQQVMDVFYLHHPSYGKSSQTGLDAYRENERLIGQLVGREKEAEAAIERFDRHMDALASKAPANAASTVVAPIFADAGYRVSGTENPFCAALKQWKVGRCVDMPSGTTNAEAVISAAPDWIAYLSSKDGKIQQSADTWGKIKAVQQGHVYMAGNRLTCCSLRGLMYSTVEYAHQVWGPSSGVPDPGPLQAYRPEKDPLLLGSAS